MLRYPVLLVLLCLVVFGHAQNFTRSPYSQFGVGRSVPRGFAQQLSGGFFVNALADSNDFSGGNPATLSNLRYTVINGGLAGGTELLSNSSAQQQTTNISFYGLTVAFPINKKMGWAGAFGIVPYSSIGYKSQSISEVSGPGGKMYGVTNSFDGAGDLSKFHAATSFRILNSVQVGVDGFMLFGNSKAKVKSVYDPAALFYDYKEDRQTSYRGFGGDLGIQYVFREKTKKPAGDTVIRKDTVKMRRKHLRNTGHYFSIGATYTPEINLQTTSFIYGRTIKAGTAFDLDRDTSIYTNDVAGTLIIPQRLSAGFGFGKQNVWGISGDFYYQAWTNFRENGVASKALANETGISAGGYFVNVRKRMRDGKTYTRAWIYRGALKYTNTNLILNGTQLTDMSVCLGIGKPFSALYKGLPPNYLNLAVEAGIMGTTSNSLVQSQYIRLHLSVNFAEPWFQRRKYE